MATWACGSSAGSANVYQIQSTFPVLCNGHGGGFSLLVSFCVLLAFLLCSCYRTPEGEDHQPTCFGSTSRLPRIYPLVGLGLIPFIQISWIRPNGGKPVWLIWIYHPSAAHAPVRRAPRRRSCSFSRQLQQWQWQWQCFRATYMTRAAPAAAFWLASLKVRAFSSSSSRLSAMMLRRISLDSSNKTRFCSFQALI